MCEYDPKHWHVKALVNPDFNSMTQAERNLRAVMLAYMVLSPICAIDATEAEISDVLYCEIANTIGDDEFVKWGDSWHDETARARVKLGKDRRAMIKGVPKDLDFALFECEMHRLLDLLGAPESTYVAIRLRDYLESKGVSTKS